MARKMPSAATRKQPKQPRYTGDESDFEPENRAAAIGLRKNINAALQRGRGARKITMRRTP